jgi:hypothetical protein
VSWGSLPLGAAYSGKRTELMKISWRNELGAHGLVGLEVYSGRVDRPEGVEP